MSNPIADPFVEVVDTDATSALVRLDATPEGVATVTINRPSRGNALDFEVIGALREAFETLAGADGVRLVFLDGAGAAFSAGVDVDWMRASADHTAADNRDDALAAAVMFKHLHDLPVLTVALVHGAAFGLGAGLVAACDMAIATADARFAFPEARSGLVAATVSPYVAAAVGPRRTRALFASARTFDAPYALAIGLVDEIVQNAAALRLAKAALARDVFATAPGAVGEAKRMVNKLGGRALDHALMDELAHTVARIRRGPEAHEGVQAALETRPPRWGVAGDA
jgi:methylglutaconyl-CoA hydratase